jgi:hypothetical protein
VSKVGTHQVVEQDGDDQGAGDDQKMMIKLQLEKEEREKQKSYGDQGKGINKIFVLAL